MTTALSTATTSTDVTIMKICRFLEHLQSKQPLPERRALLGAAIKILRSIDAVEVEHAEKLRKLADVKRKNEALAKSLEDVRPVVEGLERELDAAQRNADDLSVELAGSRELAELRLSQLKALVAPLSVISSSVAMAVSGEESKPENQQEQKHEEEAPI